MCDVTFSKKERKCAYDMAMYFNHSLVFAGALLKKKLKCVLHFCNEERLRFWNS